LFLAYLLQIGDILSKNNLDGFLTSILSDLTFSNVVSSFNNPMIIFDSLIDLVQPLSHVKRISVVDKNGKIKRIITVDKIINLHVKKIVSISGVIEKNQPIEAVA